MNRRNELKKMIGNPHSPAEKLRKLLAPESSTDSISQRPRDAIATRGKLTDIVSTSTNYSGVDLYILLDLTISMEYLVDELRESVATIGREVFERGLGNRIAIWGVYDHTVMSHPRLKDGEAIEPHPFVSDIDSFQKIVDGLTCYQNYDLPEAYECAWQMLANMLASRRTGSINKVAVATFMQTAAHGQYQGRLSRWDLGCTEGIDWRQALNQLKNRVEQFFLVDCPETEIPPEMAKDGLDDHTPYKKACVNPNDDGNEYYIPFAKSSGVLPDLIVGMVERTRGKRHYEEYCASLCPAKKGTLVKLLGR